MGEWRNKEEGTLSVLEYFKTSLDGRCGGFQRGQEVEEYGAAEGKADVEREEGSVAAMGAAVAPLRCKFYSHPGYAQLTCCTFIQGDRDVHAIVAG